MAYTCCKIIQVCALPDLQRFLCRYFSQGAASFVAWLQFWPIVCFSRKFQTVASTFTAMPAYDYQGRLETDLLYEYYRLQMLSINLQTCKLK